MEILTSPIMIGCMIIIFYIALIILIYKFIKEMYIQPKLNQINQAYSFEELLKILETICNFQLSLYEKDIFENKGAITNSNFDNFYHDLVNSIIDSLSPHFFYKMNFYIKEEAVVEIICRIVKQYLSEKVNGTT